LARFLREKGCPSAKVTGVGADFAEMPFPLINFAPLGERITDQLYSKRAGTCTDHRWVVAGIQINDAQDTVYVAVSADLTALFPSITPQIQVTETGTAQVREK